MEAKISLASSDRPRKTTARLSLPDSLPTVAAEHVEREIIEGRLRPGERLLDHTWASELGIRRGSFREVLRILARAGLVDIVPRRGASVAATSPQDVREIFFLRKHLMSLAAAAAAERITDEQVEALRNIMHRMENATGQADLSRYFRGNLAFHDTMSTSPALAASKICSSIWESRRSGTASSGSGCPAA
jgi:DNA-binding GntR family transcriptional regulator